jgi:hypothetical protein
VTRGRWTALVVFGFALAACAGEAASEERAASAPPASSEEKPRPVPIGDVSAVAKRSTESSKAAERMGLNLTRNAPFEIDARSAEMLQDDKGGESMRFRGNVSLTQGELKLTCDRLDAFFPEGRGEGRPQKFIASGDVVVVQGEFELQCTRATFEDGSCIAVCLSSETCQSGKWPEQPARFRRGKDWIEGRELEFNQCTGKMFARCGARLSVTPKAEEPAEAAEPAPEEEKAAPAKPTSAALPDKTQAKGTPK